MGADLQVNDAPTLGGGDVLLPGWVGVRYRTRLGASGGTAPYAWATDQNALPPGLELERDGTLSGTPARKWVGTVDAEVTDDAGVSRRRTFALRIEPRDRHWWSPLPLGRMTFWLTALAFGIPVLGAVCIAVYAVAAKGSTGTYLAVGLLTATTAFLVGCVAGFVVGIPHAVSSGQAAKTNTTDYLPSTNLADISDWLTKLLLGAGLVSLTRLGKPLSQLIGHVARALCAAAPPAPPTAAATVVAGTIIFGYVAVGLLDGSVVTALWYQRRLARYAQKSLTSERAAVTPATAGGTGQ